MTKRQMLHSGRFSVVEKEKTWGLISFCHQQNQPPWISMGFGQLADLLVSSGISPQLQHLAQPSAKRVSCCQLKAELLWWPDFEALPADKKFKYQLQFTVFHAGVPSNPIFLQFSVIPVSAQHRRVYRPHCWWWTGQVQHPARPAQQTNKHKRAPFTPSSSRTHWQMFKLMLFWSFPLL